MLEDIYIKAKTTNVNMSMVILPLVFKFQHNHLAL